MIRVLKSIFNILRNNWIMKLVSLILAISIWFAIYATTTTSQEYYIELDLETGLPQSYKIDTESINNSISEIKVNVWGNREFLQQEITGTTFHAKVKFINDNGEFIIKDGIGIYEVIVEPKIKLPEDQVNYNYEPKEVQLAIIDVEANTIISKKVPVNLENITINPRNGYIIKSIKTNPSEVQIQGKRKSINRIEYIFTEPIEVKDVYLNQTFDTKILFTDPNIQVNIIQPVDKTITISIEVEEAKKTKEFYNVNIDYINLDESLYIINKDELKLNSFMVTGSSTIISEIQNDDIKPYIDLKGIENPGTYPKDIKIEFTDDINFDLTEVDTFYSPQTIYIDLINSYEKDIQELGKELFSESPVNNTNSIDPFNDRAGIINESYDEDGEIENNNN